MAKKKTDPKVEVDKLLEVLIKTKHISQRELYWHSFIRGVFAGAGGVIGATVLIGIFLWILSVFGHIPLIGPLIENTKNTIESR